MEKTEILEFVKSRARATNRRDSNCAGTSFYLVGEQENDVYVSRNKSLEILSGLEDSNEPKEGNLVYWGDKNYVVHVGVVLNREKLLMAHRAKSKEMLKQVPIKEFSKYFGEPKYKTPSIFS